VFVVEARCKSFKRVNIDLKHSGTQQFLHFGVTKMLRATIISDEVNRTLMSWPRLKRTYLGSSLVFLQEFKQIS